MKLVAEDADWGRAERVAAALGERVVAKTFNCRR